MKTTAATKALMLDQEAAASRFATISAEVEHTRGSLASIDKRMGDLEKESRDSFNRVYEKLDRATSPRPTPWNLIVTGIGVLVATITAIAGGGLTAALALAAWANAYFGQSIAEIDAKAEQSIQVHAALSTTLTDIKARLASTDNELENTAKEQERTNLKIDEMLRRGEKYWPSPTPP